MYFWEQFLLTFDPTDYGCFPCLYTQTHARPHDMNLELMQNIAENQRLVQMLVYQDYFRNAFATN